MGRACCVLGCTSGGDVPSHQIPKNPDLFKKWKSMIYSEKIQHLTDEQIKRCAVCFRHFADEDYLVTYRVRKLKRGVAPSLNLPNRLVKGNMVKESNKHTNISTEKTLTMKKEKQDINNENKKATEKEERIFVVRLFEDLPETLEPCLSEQPLVPEETFEQSCQQLDTSIKQIDLIAEVCQKEFSKDDIKIIEKRISKRKRARLTEVQSILFRRKKQAENYAKTPTIQKLLSLVTAAERSSLQRRIQKSKYSPRIYIKLYHDIAKKKILSQL